MKDIKTTRGSRLLAQMIAEGEHERQDFKFAINDARKIARSLSAFANHLGGHLLIGVKDNGAIKGVANDEDAYMVELAASRYCDPPQQVDIKALTDSSGAVVIVASIEPTDHRPVYVIEENDRRVAYVRIADENIVAHPWMVNAWKLRSRMEALRLTDTDRSLLAMLAQSDDGHLKPTEIHLAMRCSKLTAQRSATRLLAAGLLEMKHVGSTFIIIEPTDSDSSPYETTRI